MSMGLFQSIWTVLALVIFVAIVVWAWSDRRKEEFDKAARMALDEGDLKNQSRTEGETIRGHHG